MLNKSIAFGTLLVALFLGANASAQTSSPTAAATKTLVAVTGQKVTLEQATTTKNGLIAIAADADVALGVDTNTAVTPAQLANVAKPVLVGEFTAAAADATFDFTTLPAATASTVLEMSINGVRIPKSAWSLASNVVTYVPASNSAAGYVIEVGDLVSFTYRK
jgi:hypothetical protein